MTMPWWLGPVLQTPSFLFLTIRGNWTPRFPRAWRGRRVTVCAHKRLHKVRMERVARDSFENWTLEWSDDEPSRAPPRAFYFKDEGITWVVGWKGPVVDAFEVTVALRAST